MSVLSVVLSLLCFALLTIGTAVFVAAEFSLTALERQRAMRPLDPVSYTHLTLPTIYSV